MQNPKTLIQHELKGLYSPGEIGSLTRLILEKEFGMSFSDILACKFNNLSDAQMRKIAEIVARLKNFEPVQYVLGEAYFFELPFYVNSSVLIPRPETEELVQWILETAPKKPIKILDIGTGSGCIAVTLAKKMPSAEVHAWDISENALEIARKNAARNGVEVFFSKKNILQQPVWEDKFDVIVSNPPYIAESEKTEMGKNVLNFEPHLALFVPDNNALIFYEKIADFALTNLNKGGKLFFEINRAKGIEIEQMLQQKGFTDIERKKDISGNERMIMAQPQKGSFGSHE